MENIPVYIPLQDSFDRRAEIIIIKTNIFQLQKSNEQMYYSCAKNWTYMVDYRCTTFSLKVFICNFNTWCVTCTFINTNFIMRLKIEMSHFKTSFIFQKDDHRYTKLPTLIKYTPCMDHHFFLPLCCCKLSEQMLILGNLP